MENRSYNMSFRSFLKFEKSERIFDYEFSYRYFLTNQTDQQKPTNLMAKLSTSFHPIWMKIMGANMVVVRICGFAVAASQRPKTENQSTFKMDVTDVIDFYCFLISLISSGLSFVFLSIPFTSVAGNSIELEIRHIVICQVLLRSIVGIVGKNFIY